MPTTSQPMTPTKEPMTPGRRSRQSIGAEYYGREAPPQWVSVKVPSPRESDPRSAVAFRHRADDLHPIAARHLCELFWIHLGAGQLGELVEVADHGRGCVEIQLPAVLAAHAESVRDAGGDIDE